MERRRTVHHVLVLPPARQVRTHQVSPVEVPERGHRPEEGRLLSDLRSVPLPGRHGPGHGLQAARLPPRRSLPQRRIHLAPLSTPERVRHLHRLHLRRPLARNQLSADAMSTPKLQRQGRLPPGQEGLLQSVPTGHQIQIRHGSARRTGRPGGRKRRNAPESANDPRQRWLLVQRERVRKRAGVPPGAGDARRAKVRQVLVQGRQHQVRTQAMRPVRLRPPAPRFGPQERHRGRVLPVPEVGPPPAAPEKATAAAAAEPKAAIRGHIRQELN